MKRSSRLTRSTPLARSPMRRRPRSAAETKRIYGGEARIRFVANLPCVVPMCPRRPCENAHVCRLNGGVGRKSDAAAIAPLCSVHHRELHTIGVLTFERLHGISLAECARRTAEAWDAHQERVA